MNNKKLCVVGLGGVGGYLGCMLAHHYDNIYFFARGERLASIKKNGLRLHSDAFGEFTTYPTMASNNAKEMGVMDYIILSVKNFSLEQVCAEISTMIDENTVIIPLLNGVNVSSNLRNLIGKVHVLDGLIYITSGASKDFSIHHTSPYGVVHIGYERQNQCGEIILLEVKKLLQGANITCIIENDIEAAIWTKYILNCAYNIVTAYYKATTGDLRKNEISMLQLKTLLAEACSVARSLKINIAGDLEDIHFKHILQNQSESATSSLNRDIISGRQNELETFSGQLLKLASSRCLKIPMTEFFYEELKKVNKF
ncbi:ketopantoate reductase family protein [Clostridium lacusfryxellense]|uniref:ketopantoate reductase family protein n=1 Tax=Clostridium lacusfryxellense TaxID=205328 RepID=UPI001C0BD2E8|nr:2-dehydropantoate 2-reductase [Clostridium lacusfryxellense]MBU3110183.1 2-dehydropantoate 2-reductase [Clostridium lacusfryxellense]